MTHILIVDDDPLNVEVLQAHLELAGYQTSHVSNGEQTLKQVQAAPPDVILMDVRMNGMSGYETTAALKADPATQHIPVMMVTAFSEKKDIQQAIAAGVDDIIFKPVNSLLMLLRIKTLVRLKQLHDQLNA